uniref:Uncharacterized protein n=1 Tax=Scophthalmus maximus TaxID=52904 RepID=A0A8D3BDZ9_SCOMX
SSSASRAAAVVWLLFLSLIPPAEAYDAGDALALLLGAIVAVVGVCAGLGWYVVLNVNTVSRPQIWSPKMELQARIQEGGESRATGPGCRFLKTFHVSSKRLLQFQPPRSVCPRSTEVKCLKDLPRI